MRPVPPAGFQNASEEEVQMSVVRTVTNGREAEAAGYRPFTYDASMGNESARTGLWAQEWTAFRIHTDSHIHFFPRVLLLEAYPQSGPALFAYRISYASTGQHQGNAMSPMRARHVLRVFAVTCMRTEEVTIELRSGMEYPAHVKAWLKGYCCLERRD